MVQWRGRRRSSNVEDIRGRGAPRPRSGMRRPGGRSLMGGGLGTIALVVIALFVFGDDAPQLLDGLLGGGPLPSAGTTVGSQTNAPAGADDGAQFVSVILADTEETWRRLFQEAGGQYPEPKLKLFSDAVESTCGYSTAASGPFYCPPDRTVYLDLNFFRDLSRLGAPGDFAQAYVIGHEVAHHVQNVTGILGRTDRMKASARQSDVNALQVLIELQADCYAGVWAHHAETRRDLLEAGDVEEGLRAAAAIGDDQIMRRAGQRVRPESFTHGSAEQRVTWFRNGLESGDLGRCETFATAGVSLR